MANYRLFLVICIASILYSIDCSSLSKQLNNVSPDTDAIPVVKPEEHPSTPPNATTTSTPNTTIHTTTTKKPDPTTKPTPPPITTISPPPPPTTHVPTPTPSPPPPTTTAAPNKHDRSFDLPSFIGGVILSLGLAAIGYVVFKFYKTRTDPNYRSI